MTNCCRFAVLALLFFFMTTLAYSSDKFDLSPGTSDRAALLDVIHLGVEKQFDVPVVLRVKSLQQQSGSVLAWLELAAADGRNLNPRHDIPYMRLTGYAYALVERQGEGWSLVATSVYGQDWAAFEKTLEKNAKGLLHILPGSQELAEYIPPWLRVLQPIPARCISLSRPAESFNAPRGVKGMLLPANTHLRIGKFDGEWVQVAYTPGAGLNECSEMAVHKQRTWIRMSSLSGPAVLAQDFVPLDADMKPVFTLQWDGAAIEYPKVELRAPGVRFRAPEPLLTAVLDGYFYEELRLYTIFTGSPAYPLALFYTGFNNDMHGDKSVFVLFGAGKVTTWVPRGRRLTPELKRVEPGRLVISESFHCYSLMDTSITIGARGVERQSVKVFVSFGHKGTGEISAPIALFNATDRTRSYRLASGDHIDRIDGYDPKTNLVHIEARRGASDEKIEGWVEMSDLDNMTVPFSNISWCGSG